MTRPRKKNPGASGFRTRDLPLSRRTPLVGASLEFWWWRDAWWFLSVGSQRRLAIRFFCGPGIVVLTFLHTNLFACLLASLLAYLLTYLCLLRSRKRRPLRTPRQLTCCLLFVLPGVPVSLYFCLGVPAPCISGLSCLPLSPRIASLICNFSFSVAARTTVSADTPLRYTGMLLGR